MMAQYTVPASGVHGVGWHAVEYWPIHNNKSTISKIAQTLLFNFNQYLVITNWLAEAFVADFMFAAIQGERAANTDYQSFVTE
jgi:hypothetical protein